MYKVSQVSKAKNIKLQLQLYPWQLCKIVKGRQIWPNSFLMGAKVVDEGLAIVQ